VNNGRVRYCSAFLRDTSEVLRLGCIKGVYNDLWQPRLFGYSTRENAGIAQLVEQLICNQQVVGSNPTAGFQYNYLKYR
jgi:hypothetical protein